jgi:hypothetical protein
VEKYLTPMIGTLIGMGILVVIMMIGFNRMLKIQREQLKRIGDDEKALQRKEKIVLASAFSNELTENKIKCEAFITIYTELLRSLRELDKSAPYEQTGDFIHQHPPLSRTIFDNNVEKLSLFGPKTANDLTATYAAIRSEPQYFTLETSMPRAAAIRIVEMVIDDAQKTLEPIEPLAAALNVVVRDGSKKDHHGI